MKRDTQNSSEAATTAAADGAWLELVRQQVGSLRFGVVQDGRVVQIEKTERVRLEKPVTEKI